MIAEATSASLLKTVPTSAEMVQLYQTLYWIAQTAAAPTPPAELIHVTAAGWASIPALVDHRLYGTPILVTEHGMYVRESYLGSVLRDDPPGFQWINTRIARSFSVAACRAASVVSPVTSTHVAWEELLGADPANIRPIPNGVHVPDEAPPPLPNTNTVVMVGRFDPLKDIHTALRTAAEVVRRVPDVRFLHYGPVDPMQTAYAESCEQLHRQLGLGDTFKFMGSTNNVTAALHDADVVISTSISEGLPIAILEAMAQGRPVAATAVGGVRESLTGCGMVTAPRDQYGLAAGVVTSCAIPRSPSSSEPARITAWSSDTRSPRAWSGTRSCWTSCSIRSARPGPHPTRNRTSSIATGDDMSSAGPDAEQLATRIKPRQALAVVEARLGRPPRDGLEAAVVLEAWAGLRPHAALELGDQVMEHVPDRPSPTPHSRRSAVEERVGWFGEILGLLGFVSMASWGVPLGQMLPESNVDLAFKIGVPLALAVQWIVRRRYFSAERRLGSFGSDGLRFLLVMLVSLVAFTVAGPTGALIAALEVIWFSGYLLGKDGLGGIYVVGLGVTTVALYSDVPPVYVLLPVGAVLAAAATICVIRHNRVRNRKTERVPPVVWTEVFPSAVIGASLGIMMVFSLTHLRPNGWTLAVALIPAGIATLVAAGLLKPLWVRLSADLDETPAPRFRRAGARSVARRLTLTWTVYAAVAVALSCMVVPALTEAGRGILPAALLLLGFTLFCALAMMADFQHSWNRIGWATAIAVPACGVELVVRFTAIPDGSAALVAGAAVGLVISAIPMTRLARRPSEILATAVSIP